MGNNEINDIDLEKHVILTTFADDFASKIDGIISLKKDDVIMIRVPDDFYYAENAAELRKIFKTLGINNKVAVFHDSMKINVIRKED